MKRPIRKVLSQMFSACALVVALTSLQSTQNLVRVNSDNDIDINEYMLPSPAVACVATNSLRKSKVLHRATGHAPFLYFCSNKRAFTVTTRGPERWPRVRTEELQEGHTSVLDRFPISRNSQASSILCAAGAMHRYRRECASWPIILRKI